MPWFPVDDAFHSHPKARRAGDEALGMWTRAGSHCMAYLTDGFVADWWVREQPKGATKARRLVAAELWRPTQRNGEPGFQFHDWKPECTKAHVLDVREKARQRKAKSRESHEQSRVTVAEPDAGVLGFNQTKPNQTKPISTSVVTSGGGVTQVAAHEPPPRPKCPDHEENFDGPCIPCKRRREWDEKRADQLKADELERKRTARGAATQARKACQHCDELGWVLDADGLTAEPAVKCDHQEAVHA